MKNKEFLTNLYILWYVNNIGKICVLSENFIPTWFIIYFFSLQLQVSCLHSYFPPLQTFIQCCLHFKFFCEVCVPVQIPGISNEPPVTVSVSWVPVEKNIIYYLM